MMTTTELKMQPSLFYMPTPCDDQTTPLELAADMVTFFKPSGTCLDPCRGSGVFWRLLPPDAMWCEISEGVDFYSWSVHVDWVIGNPPYSHYSAWLRHSMKVADHLLYLMPTYKVFASGKFQDDLFSWGGIAHIRRYGTGTEWGFPFGHGLAAVHYQRDYDGPTHWSRYSR